MQIDRVDFERESVDGKSCINIMDRIDTAIEAHPLPAVPVEEVTMYTDGSAMPAGEAGYGAYGYDAQGNIYNSWGFVSRNGTNNRAEMVAFIFLLKAALYFKWKTVHAVLDSRYVMDNARRNMNKWYKRNWLKSNGDMVCNKDLWVVTHQLLLQLRANGQKITYKWVRGHSGNQGNDAADKNALKGRLAAGKGCPLSVLNISDVNAPVKALTSISKSKRTAKVKIPSCNKMIAGKRLIFSTNSVQGTKDGKHIYMVTSFDDAKGLNGSLCGELSSSNFYGVVLTKEPVPQIDALVEYQNMITPDDYVQPIIGLLDRIQRKENWAMLTEFGFKHLSNQRLNVITVDKEPLTYYVRPPRLSYNTLDILAVLLDRVDCYRFNHYSEDASYHDITTAVYEDTGKLQRLHTDDGKSLTHVTATITLMGKPVPVTLTVGVTLPPRININAIGKAKEGVRVTMVTYDTNQASFRFALIFETLDDIAIYSTGSANAVKVP